MSDEDAYLRALNFVGANQDGKAPGLSALDRAHDIRKFEIDLYWKRSTYFFALQVAVFTGFGFCLPSSRSQGLPELALLMACMGLLTATASLCSARGSKFWLKNWEQHIDSIEDEFEGRLHKAVWLSEGKPAWSVSQVNEALCMSFMALWGLIVVYVLIWMAKMVDVWGLDVCHTDGPATLKLLHVLAALGGTIYLTTMLWKSRSDIAGDVVLTRRVGDKSSDLRIRVVEDEFKPPA